MPNGSGQLVNFKNNNRTITMKTLAYLISRIYLIGLTFCITINASAQIKMADKIIIRGTSFDQLSDAIDGDTLDIEFHDGKLFTKATKLKMNLVHDTEYVRSFTITGLTVKARLNINMDGTGRIHGNLQMDGSDEIYILDSYDGKYNFIRKPKEVLIID